MSNIVGRFGPPMGRDRVELSTPALSERCSNQLSYHPERNRKKKDRHVGQAPKPGPVRRVHRADFLIYLPASGRR